MGTAEGKPVVRSHCCVEGDEIGLNHTKMRDICHISQSVAQIPAADVSPWTLSKILIPGLPQWHSS